MAPAGGLDADLDGCTDDIDGLIELTASLDDQEVVSSLLAKLENARDAAQRGNVRAAINMLGAYTNEVAAQRRKLGDTDADLLTQYAMNVLSDIRASRADSTTIT